MNSVAGPVEPRDDQAGSRNMLVVRAVHEAIEEEGIEAGLERLLSHAHSDFEFRPYVAGGRVLRGADEVRSFFRERLDAGIVLTLRPASFEERANEVVVNGSLRVVRPTGGFAESQISWTYRFRDGRLEDARWGPRQAA